MQMRVEYYCEFIREIVRHCIPCRVRSSAEVCAAKDGVSQGRLKKSHELVLELCTNLIILTNRVLSEGYFRSQPTCEHSRLTSAEVDVNII
jgi:hypothetical protein